LRRFITSSQQQKQHQQNNGIRESVHDDFHNPGSLPLQYDFMSFLFLYADAP